MPANENPRAFCNWPELVEPGPRRTFWLWIRDNGISRPSVMVALAVMQGRFDPDDRDLSPHSVPAGTHKPGARSIVLYDEICPEPDPATRVYRGAYRPPEDGEPYTHVRKRKG